MRESLFMGKRRVLLSIPLATSSLLALMVVACEETSSVFEDEQLDAAFDTPPSLINPDSGARPDGSAVSCDPTLPEDFEVRWTAPTKDPACSDTDLSDYYDACLTAQPPDAGDPCTRWKEAEAHSACAACIERPDNSGPIEWHRDRYYWTLNVAGCLALERSEPEPGECPATYAASIQCQRAACDGCFEATQATFSDFQACQAAAKASACATYEAKIGEVCGTTYNDPDGGAFDCFRQDGDRDAKEHFVRVEGIFCGR